MVHLEYFASAGWNPVPEGFDSAPLWRGLAAPRANFVRRKQRMGALLPPQIQETTLPTVSATMSPVESSAHWDAWASRFGASNRREVDYQKLQELYLCGRCFALRC